MSLRLKGCPTGFCTYWAFFLPNSGVCATVATVQLVMCLLFMVANTGNRKERLHNNVAYYQTTFTVPENTNTIYCARLKTHTPVLAMLSSSESEVHAS